MGVKPSRRNTKPVTLERFIGRVSELASLRGAIERLKSGTGAVHLVTGDPGIGKTRLCEEAVAYAVARGLDVRLGRCSESDGVPSFWPWLQILRDSQGRGPQRSGPTDQSLQQRLVEASRRLDPTASPKQDAQDRFQLFDAVTDFLRQELSKRPMVIAIDDLHRADQASLELLSL